MNKERLEEIEKSVSNMSKGMPTQVITWQGWKDVITLLEDDYKYLFEQAQRVEEQQKEIELTKADLKVYKAKWKAQGGMIQKLQDENEQLKEDVNRMENEYIHDVKTQNARLREALEEIKTLRHHAYPTEYVFHAESIARKALEEIK